MTRALLIAIAFCIASGLVALLFSPAPFPTSGATLQVRFDEILGLNQD